MMGRNKICDEQYCIKEYIMVYSFSFISFLSQRVFPCKVLTRHILLSMDTQGECYELMVVHWFDTITHMIDTHMIHYSLCKYVY